MGGWKGKNVNIYLPRAPGRPFEASELSTGSRNVAGLLIKFTFTYFFEKQKFQLKFCVAFDHSEWHDYIINLYNRSISRSIYYNGNKKSPRTIKRNKVTITTSFTSFLYDFGKHVSWGTHDLLLVVLLKNVNNYRTGYVWNWNFDDCHKEYICLIESAT
jgi:hypothetical protein